MLEATTWTSEVPEILAFEPLLLLKAFMLGTLEVREHRPGSEPGSGYVSLCANGGFSACKKFRRPVPVKWPAHHMFYTLSCPGQCNYMAFPRPRQLCFKVDPMVPSPVVTTRIWISFEMLIKPGRNPRAGPFKEDSSLHKTSCLLFSWVLKSFGAETQFWSSTPDSKK